MKTKMPKQEFVVKIPSASFSPITHALLSRATRPPSRAGKQAMKLEKDIGASRQTTQLQLDELDDIGHLLQLHVARPNNMYGAAVVKKGRASAHDMLVCGLPAVLRCAALATLAPSRAAARERRPRLRAHAAPACAPQLHGAHPARGRGVHRWLARVLLHVQCVGVERRDRRPQAHPRRRQRCDEEAHGQVREEHSPRPRPVGAEGAAFPRLR
eukprot:4717889-Prymnesium_polylepis.1